MRSPLFWKRKVRGFRGSRPCSIRLRPIIFRPFIGIYSRPGNKLIIKGISSLKIKASLKTLLET